MAGRPEDMSRDGDVGVCHPATSCPLGSSLNQNESCGTHSVLNSVWAAGGYGKRAHDTSQRRTKGRSIGSKIGSFNVKGRYTQHESELSEEKEALSMNNSKDRIMTKVSKYPRIMNYMRRNKILLLCVQETKLKGNDHVTIMEENPLLEVKCNNDPEGKAKSGIAFLLNKNITRNKAVTHDVIIPGRASRIIIQLGPDERLNVVNIYAPNIEKEKIAFYKKLKSKLSEMNDMEDMIMMGDFNMVNESIDRLPQRKDEERVMSPINAITSKYHLVDGWRKYNDKDLDYTFTSASNSSSARIDRIYVPKSEEKFFSEWKIESTLGISDHKLITVFKSKENTPYIGKGLWRMNHDLVEYEPFRTEVGPILMKLEEELDSTEFNQSSSPQSLWVKAKEKIVEVAKEKEKQRKAQINKKRTTLMKKKNRCLRLIRLNIKDMHQTNEEQYKKNVQKLREWLKDIENDINRHERIRIENAREMTKARFELLGEQSNEWFFNLKQTEKEDQTIYAIKDRNGKLQTETTAMAEAFRQYHEKQAESPTLRSDWEQVSNKVIKSLKKSLSKDEQRELEETFTEQKVLEAIKKGDNGKAPGCDGFIYEFWKNWVTENTVIKVSKETGKNQKITVNIVKILTRIFNDIEANGMKEKEFSKGTMFLLYKNKGEKNEAKNYRPITLLNTDYKIMTKAIATELGNVAPKLIHENQTGFIPGRGLFDNVQLSHMLISYCEQKQINGCIIALDQEKAYDRIAHKYLWKVLEKYKIPRKMIQTIQHLYMNTETSIMVNGTMSDPVKINRGVRQGDPMSCLLYVMAIEPLAEMLRDSKLKGIKIKGVEDKVLTSLFADDTLVSLDKKDDKKVMDKCLDDFCGATTAKFNEDKTEYLPVGTKEYREWVVKNKKLNLKAGNEIEATAKIVSDGESMRQLGGRIGNSSNETKQWEDIVKRQEKVLNQWKGANLTFKGKELILKALVISLDQFLATVNTMPKWVQERTSKLTKDFLWKDKKRGLIDWKWVTSPKEQGGLNMPSIEMRCEAIEIMWAKKWLAPPGKRPTWAFVLDEIINMNVTKRPIIDEEARINWVTQNWHESDATWAKIPVRIQTMLKTVRKYNIGIEALKISPNTKGMMPIWHHIDAQSNMLWSKKAAKCLRRIHKVVTVDDLENVINNTHNYPNACESPNSCESIANKLRDVLSEKFNPMNITPHKDNLDHTPNRLLNAKKRTREQEEDEVNDMGLDFNPDITEREHPLQMVRIFRKGPPLKKRRIDINYNREPPKYRDPPHTPSKRKGEKVKIYTDGSSSNSGSLNSKNGAGLWISDNHKDNKSIKVGIKGAHNGTCELVGALYAVRIETPSGKIILSDSRLVVDGMTKWLKHWEDIAWLNVDNKDLWMNIANDIRKQPYSTAFKWIKGHVGIHGNEEADKLADEGANKPGPADNLNLQQIHELKYVHKSARLQALTQKYAYELIRQWNTKKPRNKKKELNIKTAQKAVKDYTSLKPREQDIWMGLQLKEIPNIISDFIWKIIHDRIKCGNYFANMSSPEWKEKQYCECGKIETIEHILLKCKLNKARTTWKALEVTWKSIDNKGYKLPKITMGIIMGLSVIKYNTGKSRKDFMEDKNVSNRLKTLLSTAVWYIWKNRNNRIFNKVKLSNKTTRQRWNATIKERILLEWKMLDINKKTRGTEMQRFAEKWARAIKIPDKGKDLAVTL
ncbi:hypothetical protein HHX47_DHR5000756 [Lentinula edodes]|nr:hypothetical protein HHX47_DHR5000756 [Lentinula edodes]